MSDIIVALDGQDWSEVTQLINKLHPNQCRVKIGLEAFTAFGERLINYAHERGFQVFLDLKFHDIPNTVYGAVKAAASLGVWMLNVHLSGGAAMLSAAREAANSVSKPPLLIGVSILTSLDDKALAQIGLPSIEAILPKMIIAADAAGLDGVVCSAFEVPTIKSLSPRLLTVTPGIRLTDANQDQMRVATPNFARQNGADHLVIGRAITQSENPLEVLAQIERG